MIRKPVDLIGLQQAFPYPRSTTGATSDLGREVIAEIAKAGPLPFSDYMARCLYDPVHGYYSRPEVATVSQEGDFVTSVSVGPVFGRLLAARLHRFWKSNGSPTDFPILEPGGHEGNLAKDLLSGFAKLDPELAKAVRYHVCEPHPARRAHLENLLGDLATVIARPDELRAPFGAIIANEVLDALPVPLHYFDGREWLDAAVASDGERLDWTTLPSDFSLPGDYPQGFLTEGPPAFSDFLRPLAECFEASLSIFIDYGLDEASLYHPDRTAGTLRCYRRHRSNVHPLDDPGLCDLTADVNFTAVERAAEALGMTPHPVMNQGRYLTYCGREWLLASPTPHEIRQFQTLIHPSQFGGRFYAAEFTKGDLSRAFPE